MPARRDRRLDPRRHRPRRAGRRIAEASGNEYLVEFIQMIDAKEMENLRSLAVKNALVAETGASVLAGHQEVLAALRDRDAGRARNATRRRFESAASRLADRADFANV